MIVGDGDSSDYPLDLLQQPPTGRGRVGILLLGGNECPDPVGAPSHNTWVREFIIS